MQAPGQGAARVLSSPQHVLRLYLLVDDKQGADNRHYCYPGAALGLPSCTYSVKVSGQPVHDHIESIVEGEVIDDDGPDCW